MKYVTDSYDPQTGRVTEQNTQADTAKTSVDDLHYRYWHHHPQKPAPVTTSRTYNSGPSQASCGTSTGQCISPHGGHGVFSWLKKGGTWTLGLLSGFTSLAGAGLSAAEAAELAGLASAGGWMSQAEYDALVGTGVMQGLEEGEAAACGESFTASTKVLLGPGAAVPISALKPGDKVLATNVKTGKTQPETVAAVLVHHDTDLYNLKVKSGHRTTVIHTTANHLFWDTTTRHWVKAASLHPGDHLRTPGGGGATATAAGGYTPRQQTGWMWDLTIPGDHDFYIFAVVSSVLVHNDCAPLNNADATELAKKLGYRPTNFFSRGQRVFYNGKNYITQDIDSQSGGVWKMAKTVRALGSKATRMGTYDANGNYVGP